MRAINVMLQNAYTQTGIEKDPVIKWEYGSEDAGKKQKMYRVQVLDENGKIYADSGVVNSSDQNNILLKTKLQSQHFYNINVQITDNEGEAVWSKGSGFLSGIQQEDWMGKWIGTGSNKPFIAGKELLLSKEVKSACISICGLGQFEAIINESKIGEGCLYGSWTDYNKRLHYWTFDITEMLHAGSNQLSIEVGNGWYIGDTSQGRHFYTMGRGYQPFGKELTCRCQLRLRYSDGTEDIISTDETWAGCKSPVIMTNVYGSEDYDARLEYLRGALFPAAGAGRGSTVHVLQQEQEPRGSMYPALYPPVKVIKTYQPVSAIQMEAGGIIYDLGQNMSGLFEVSVKGKRGTSIKVTPAEKMSSEGNIIPSVDTWSTYVLKGSGETESFCPKFSYAAGRWLQVEAFAEEGDELPEIVGVKGHFISTAARDTGEFDCSDKRYVQIHDLIKKTVESNLNHIHTDCPTFEKLGWQELNHLMGSSIMYLKDVETLWTKLADDMRDAQYGKEEYDTDSGAFPHQYGPGLVPSVAPGYAKFLIDYGAGSFWDIPPWGSSILLAVDLLKTFYGNERAMEENYNAARKYINYLWEKYENYPQIYNENENIHFLRHGLGDWGTDLESGECRENVETAYLYYDLCVLSQWCRRLGDEPTAKLMAERAERVCTEYNRELLVKDQADNKWGYIDYPNIFGKKILGNQALPLYFNMVPLEKREEVKQQLLSLASDARFHSGEICLRYILAMLARYGKNDLIGRMIMQEEHPSYLRFIEKGETTLPEFWSDDARSRNHDMMGHILEWFYSKVGGISSEDGFKTVKISPCLVGGMTEIKCTYQSIGGKIEVYVKKEADLCHLEVVVPVNMTAVIEMPSGAVKVDGGRYRYQYK